MNIVLCAFAVSPDSGSESGVGWGWLRSLVEDGHDVTLVTRSDHAARLAMIKRQGLFPEVFQSVEVRGVGPNLIEAIGLKVPFFLYPYLLLWNAMVAIWLLNHKRFNKVHVVHHVTYAGVRIPIFTPIVFKNVIWGPVGGGETAPPPLMRHQTISARIKESVRSLSNFTLSFNPLMFPAFYMTKHIYVLTRETKNVLPKSSARRAQIRPNIGVDEYIANSSPLGQTLSKHPSVDYKYFVFVARFIYWKGGDLAIRAFANYVAGGGVNKLVMVGDGPARPEWLSLAIDLGVNEQIVWTGRIDHEAALEWIAGSCAMVFPSLHDSGGTVVFEALSRGLPLVCLDCGGPGEISRSVGLSPVNVTSDSSFDSIISELTKRLQKIDHSVVELARQRLLSIYSWRQVVENIYQGSIISERPEA